MNSSVKIASGLLALILLPGIVNYVQNHEHMKLALANDKLMIDQLKQQVAKDGHQYCVAKMT